jgi:membrane protein YqaA with SNARE-associated domain
VLVLIVGASVACSVLLIQHWEYVKMLEKQGLLGLFVIALFAGSPIPIPTPSMILTFTMGSIFNPVLVALVSSFGNACGNGLVYLAGHGGLVFFKNLGIIKQSDQKDSDSEDADNTSLKEGQKPTIWKRIVRWCSLPWIRKFARKNALLAVFILGMYPNPIHMAVVMGMGAARYSFWKFFLVCWAGKLVESLVLSYLGYFGLRSILHYFGIALP